MYKSHDTWIDCSVFALREAAYQVYDSHYSGMEHCLGTLISMVNDGDYPTTVRNFVQRRLVIEARYEELIEKVEDAEQGETSLPGR